MNSEVNFNNTGSAALQAINKMSETNFIKAQEAAKEMAFSCWFFYGSDIESCAKDKMRYVDPRGLYLSDENDKSYINFAASENPEYQFVYVDKTDLTLHSANVRTLYEQIANYADLTSGEIKNESNINVIVPLIAGCEYLNKFDLMKNLYPTKKNMLINVYKNLLTNYASDIEQNYEQIAGITYYSKDEIKKVNGGFFSKTASFCSSSIKQKYEQNISEYKKCLEELKQILAKSSSLTICYQNNTLGSTNVGDNSTNNLIYTNINQVMNCCENEAAEMASESKDEDIYKQILTQIQELRASITVKDDIYKMIDEKIDQKISNTQNKNTVVKTSNSIIIIIILIILVILVFGNYGLSFMSLFKLKQQGQQKN